jgi:hypothetical protein
MLKSAYSISSLQYETDFINRQFFMTSDFRMCFGLDDMDEDDLIALFLGTQVPFVVREVASDVYILVGECYVYGIMDGEAMQDVAKWQASLRDIVLKWPRRSRPTLILQRSVAEKHFKRHPPKPQT